MDDTAGQYPFLKNGLDRTRRGLLKQHPRADGSRTERLIDSRRIVDGVGGIVNMHCVDFQSVALLAGNRRKNELPCDLFPLRRIEDVHIPLGPIAFGFEGLGLTIYKEKHTKSNIGVAFRLYPISQIHFPAGIEIAATMREILCMRS